MEKTLILWFKIVVTIILFGICSVFLFSTSEHVCLQMPFILILVGLASVFIIGFNLEHREVPGLPGSVRYKSATEAELKWAVYSTPDSGTGEFIILRKVESSGAFEEVGRSYGPTFTDSTVDSTRTNYYQVFEGKDALSKKNRFFTPILELKPFKK